MSNLNNFDFMSSENFFNSDLALERRRADTTIEGVEYKRDVCLGGIWERLKITSEEGEKSIGRPIGLYDTLTVTRMDSITPEDIEDAKDEVSRELCRICDLCDIMPGRILVVGLGNRELTPDSLGPLAAGEVEATMHIKEANEEFFETLGCSEIATICPDVTANTGLNTADIVRGVCKITHPDVVFAIDSLASRSPERLGNTIQVSSTGIFPGTGLGSHPGCAINESLVGVPVIAIGVPTVINSGAFSEAASRNSRKNTGMFLSPKGIDRIVKNAAKIVGGGINQAFGICYF